MRMTIEFVVRRAAAAAVVVVALVSAVPPPASAQSGGGGGGRSIESVKREDLERRSREDAQRMASWELRLLERSKTPERKRDLTLAYAQIREDYRQLQIVNNALAQSLSSGALELAEAAKSVSEIRKRAARLKENLSLPEPEKPAGRARPEMPEAAEQFKPLLLALDRLVLEFVNNPIFEHPQTVDVRMSAKARADLEGIIALSDQIKKSGEKLKKATRKTQ